MTENQARPAPNMRLVYAMAGKLAMMTNGSYICLTRRSHPFLKSVPLGKSASRSRYVFRGMLESRCVDVEVVLMPSSAILPSLILPSEASMLFIRSSFMAGAIPEPTGSYFVSSYKKTKARRLTPNRTLQRKGTSQRKSEHFFGHDG